MNIQQVISSDLNAEKIGECIRVVIDRVEGEYYIGRSEFDSPEVDPEILIPKQSAELVIGEFYNATIIDADDFDLYAVIKS